ncbi:MAG: D-alanyl-D-alanine carboxypeptidase [Burkholderiaceae bacterium]
MRIRLTWLCIALFLMPTAALAADPLPSEVTALLRRSGLPLSSFGIDVRSVEAGAPPPWLALNAERPFLLASTTKLVTSLAALDLLGQGRRWRTEAHATGPVADGRLVGNLVIVGGELGLTAPELRRWFTQMRAEGLVEVVGDIVLNDVALLDEAEPAQALATAQELRDDLPPAARAYNAGKLLVSIQPAPGTRAAVTLQPRPANVHIDNDVSMGGEGCAAWARWKSPAEARGGPPLQLWVRGHWGEGCGREDIAYVRPHSDLRFAPELGAAPALAVSTPRMVAALWAETGGRLRGRVVEVEDAASAPRRAGRSDRRWSSEISTPLAEVMREMNKTSNNAAAHNLLLALGRGMAPPAAAPEPVGAAHPPDVPQRGAEPRTSAASNPAAVLRTAHARIHDWMRGQGLADGDIEVVEGSGRSRAERGRPRALVHLLRNAWRSAGSQAFVDSLPIAGVDGTLLHRMRSGAASGQAFLKTGTLSDTRALAGYVRARSGKVYAVTAIVTHANAARGRPALDALIEWVAQHG